MNKMDLTRRGFLQTTNLLAAGTMSLDGAALAGLAESPFSIQWTQASSVQEPPVLRRGPTKAASTGSCSNHPRAISCRDDESWGRQSRKLREGSPVTDRTERFHAVRRIRLPPVAWAVRYSMEACAVDSWQSGHRNYHDKT